MSVLKTRVSLDNYMGYASDAKPTGPEEVSNGMTFTEVDTGKIWVWFDKGWKEDLTLIYAAYEAKIA